MIVSPREHPGEVEERADVVVIGTGAGGAVAAAELAEAGAAVVVLEEGDHYSGRDFDGRPLEQIRRLYRRNGFTGTLGNTFIPVPLGRAVGGTTLINSGTCWRAPEAVLSEWEDRYGIPDLAGGGLATEYESVEKILGVAPVPEDLIGPSARLFRLGAESLGIEGQAIPRNAVGCRGTGVCVFGCPRDAKQATHVSYVPRALAAGAQLHVCARVEGIETSEGRVTGVRATRLDDHGGVAGSLRVRAPRVVLAAGALLSPALLARSGLAPRRSWVGRNLRIHPATRVLALFEEPVRAWEGVPQSYHIQAFEAEGIFLQGMVVPPEIQAPTLPGVGPAHKARMAAYDRIASFGVLIHDTVTGRVFPLGREGVSWYWMDRAGVRRMLRGISIAARIFFAAGAREVYPGVRQRPVLRSVEEAEALEHLEARAGDLEMMAFHPMGTIRMGARPQEAALDPNGRVRGVSGLYVSDASVFPSSTRVNPQLTIMALATRMARSLAREGA